MPDPKPRVGFLENSEGEHSMMRVLTLGAFIMASILALLIATGKATGDATVELTLYFLVAAFGGKVGQAFTERKKP